MNDVLVALAASSPFLAYLLWAAWWFPTDTLRERLPSTRRRTCGHPLPRPAPSRPPRQNRHGQAPAA